MSVKFTSYGAAREVTGSNHLLEINGKKILVDCGMFQGKRILSEKKNRIFQYDPAKVDSVLLTHAHCDHSCRLPYLMMKGFDGNIYSTPATRDIASLIMYDTAHIQQKDAEWLNKKKAAIPFEPLFNVNDVLNCLNHFVTIGYGRKFFADESVGCTFHNAGHILGSSTVVFDCGSDRRIGFSGDLGRPGTPIIHDPEYLPPLDYFICEATYGNRLHDPIEDACKQLAAVIKEAVSRGGKIIIPAFAVERTQDIIYYLHLLLDQKKIPKLEIFVDSPMAFNATSIFRVHQECYDDKVNEQFIVQNKNPFGFENLHYTTNVNESKQINELKDPCIIISSSGMCEAGRILHHLKNNIEDPKNTILVVGYMAEDTLGRKIADREPQVKIFGQPYKLRANVKILNTFSAHADYKDVMDFVGHLDLDRLKRIYLVHGEDESLEGMRTHLLDMHVKDVQIVEPEIKYTMYE